MLSFTSLLLNSDLVGHTIFIQISQNILEPVSNEPLPDPNMRDRIFAPPALVAPSFSAAQTQPLQLDIGEEKVRLQKFGNLALDFLSALLHPFLCIFLFLS